MDLSFARKPGPLPSLAPSLPSQRSSWFMIIYLGVSLINVSLSLTLWWNWERGQVCFSSTSPSFSPSIEHFAWLTVSIQLIFAGQMDKRERIPAISKPEGKGREVESQPIDHVGLAAPRKILWQVPALCRLIRKYRHNHYHSMIYLSLLTMILTISYHARNLLIISQKHKSGPLAFNHTQNVEFEL